MAQNISRSLLVCRLQAMLLSLCIAQSLVFNNKIDFFYYFVLACDIYIYIYIYIYIFYYSRIYKVSDFIIVGDQVLLSLANT